MYFLLWLSHLEFTLYELSCQSLSLFIFLIASVRLDTHQSKMFHYILDISRHAVTRPGRYTPCLLSLYIQLHSAYSVSHLVCWPLHIFKNRHGHSKPTCWTVSSKQVVVYQPNYYYFIEKGDHIIYNTFSNLKINRCFEKWLWTRALMILTNNNYTSQFIQMFNVPCILIKSSN